MLPIIVPEMRHAMQAQIKLIVLETGSLARSYLFMRFQTILAQVSLVTVLAQPPLFAVLDTYFH